MPKPRLGFIGAGKVGHTLARLWYAKGYVVCAVYSRTPDHAVALAEQVGAEVLDAPAEVIRACDLTLLTVPDDTLETVVVSIAQRMPVIREGSLKAVIHTSGAWDKDVLSRLAPMGIMTGSLHPAYPFADIESALVGLPGATFGVEADSEVLREWLEELVASLNGRALAIPPGEKAAYHSAFVFASNYAVTLYAIAERLLLGLGADHETADHALNTLLAGTLDNLRRQGIPAALTGPLVRGDVHTVMAHLEALEAIDGDLSELYRQLARQSLPILAARNIDTTFVEQLLNRK